MRAARRQRASAAALALLLAATPSAAGEVQRMRAAIAPETAALGERVTYRGAVVLAAGADAGALRWLAPDSSETLYWGEARTRFANGVAPRRAGAAARGPASPAALHDTAFVEVPLQIFDTGLVPVPGMRFEVRRGAEWIEHRLPLVRMPIVPVLAAADSQPSLRPLRGPLSAPWWERVPWVWVAGALVALALIWRLWRWLRRPRPSAPAVPAPMVAREDPAAEALRELAALRRQGLPEAGRFADHAFQLTRILKRYLERTRGTPRPGHTTPELVAGLRAAGAEDGEVRRIAALLNGWDRVKFARAESGAAEARADEDAVEALVRGGTPGARGVAA
jgi:hypothetical protein